MALPQPTPEGRFGEFGGRFGPETLVPACAEREELATALARDYAPLREGMERLDLTLDDIRHQHFDIACSKYFIQILGHPGRKGLQFLLTGKRRQPFLAVNIQNPELQFIAGQLPGILFQQRQ